MRDIIINLMEKLIVPKYGPMDYHVVSTNDFGSRRDLGYIIHCELKQNQHIDVVRDLENDLVTLLQMLGLRDVKRDYSSWVLKASHRKVDVIGIKDLE